LAPLRVQCGVSLPLYHFQRGSQSAECGTGEIGRYPFALRVPPSRSRPSISKGGGHFWCRGSTSRAWSNVHYIDQDTITELASSKAPYPGARAAAPLRPLISQKSSALAVFVK